jgi:hypothetical protein
VKLIKRYEFGNLFSFKDKGTRAAELIHSQTPRSDASELEGIRKEMIELVILKETTNYADGFMFFDNNRTDGVGSDGVLLTARRVTAGPNAGGSTLQMTGCCRRDQSVEPVLSPGARHGHFRGADDVLEMADTETREMLLRDEPDTSKTRLRDMYLQLKPDTAVGSLLKNYFDKLCAKWEAETPDACANSGGTGWKNAKAAANTVLALTSHHLKRTVSKAMSRTT